MTLTNKDIQKIIEVLPTREETNKKFDEVGNNIKKVSAGITSNREEIKKVSAVVISNREDIKDLKQDVAGLRESIQALTVSVDKLVKATENLSQEYAAVTAKNGFNKSLKK